MSVVGGVGRASGGTRLRVHCLQHAEYEGPGAIAAWAASRGYRLAASHAHRGGALPAPDDVDLLVALGGACGVGDMPRLPWLRDEARLVEQAVARGTPVLGVCLGAQVVAHVLGARVARGAEREIGWFPVDRVAGAEGAAAFARFPPRLDAFHWHGDAFDLPPGAVRVAESAACACQAFAWGDRVAAVQFHPEMTYETARALAREDAADLVDGGRYVQTAESMLADPGRFARQWPVLWDLLDALARRA